jgi:hypothetical protein
MIYNFQKERTTKPLTKKQKKYNNILNARHHKKHYRKFNLSVRYDNAQDVIDQLEKQENIVQYIVNLIRKDINNQ